MKPPETSDTDPHYYRQGGIQAWDVVDAYNLDYHLGCVLKYILRAGKKGSALTDLLKAEKCLQRRIEKEKAFRAKALEAMKELVAMRADLPCTGLAGAKAPSGRKAARGRR